MPVPGVMSVLISITVLPRRFAISPMDAAGSTTPDVPTIIITSQLSMDKMHLSIVDMGIISPNQTTFGLIIASHFMHWGGITFKGTV